jgi:hypothetical protein
MRTYNKTNHIQKINKLLQESFVNQKNYEPNISAGSTYSVEINIEGGNKVSLRQDNNNEVIILLEDIPQIIEKLKEIYQS